MKAKAFMGLHEEEKKRMSELSVSNLGVTKTNIVAELNESEDGDDSSKAFERQTTEQQNLGSIHIAAVDS